MIEAYILAQGSGTLESCNESNNTRYTTLTLSHDHLGWDSFIKGQISIFWLNVIWIKLNLWSPQKSVEKWGVGFIKSLISLTHKQWIYQNSDVHHRIEGLTSSDHLILCDKIWALMRTNRADLLPCHCHLLTQDFHSLGSSATIQCQIWVASMESALSAAAQVAFGPFTPGSLAIFNQTPLPAHLQVVQPFTTHST